MTFFSCFCPPGLLARDSFGKFPVKPGAKMPTFDGCNTQDWAVLFVVGVEA